MTNFYELDCLHEGRALLHTTSVTSLQFHLSDDGERESGVGSANFTQSSLMRRKDAPLSE